MENKYHFNLDKAKIIHNNKELLEKEASEMKKAFNKQGNESHFLEGQSNYQNALFMEKVFYEELVPIYKNIK